MSFSRAKVHRFNDVQSDVPSPTRYDPKMDKTKGGLISKTEQRERTTSQSDVMSTGSTPFRTPYSVPKKHSCFNTGSEKSEKSATARCVNFGDVGVTPSQQLTLTCDDRELNFLREDCSNKAETIADLERIVDSLTLKVTSLETEKLQLEEQVNQLEAAKSDLEATAVNNENYDKQVKDLSQWIIDLEAKISKLDEEKEDLLSKKSHAEERIAKFEEESLEYERRIVSLEGTLEQVQLESREKEKEVSTLQEAADKLKITIECLQGKISMYEATKSSNEETIFSLETQLSSLKSSVETAKNERISFEDRIMVLQKEIADKKEACKNHEDTIMELGMELESKVAEIRKAQEEKNLVLQQHNEEVFRLQNEWEKKFLAQMQKKEQCLMEKDAIIKLSDLKYSKMIGDTRVELEKKLGEAEKEANMRLSAQIESYDRMKEKFEKDIANLETTISDLSKEAGTQSGRYDEVVVELNALVAEVTAKESVISELSSKNDKLHSRVDNMLGEIKILNADIDEKSASLEEMKNKFELEWKKNEKLSEQLGELDAKVIEFENELRTKSVKSTQLLDDLNKLRSENKELKVENLDLRLVTETQKESIATMKSEADTSRENFNAQLLELTEELADVKRQCRKFEIAMSDTRKSLDALGKRLIESEGDVENLTLEKEELNKKLAKNEENTKEVEKNYRQAMEEKIDLAQKLTAAESVEENLRKKVQELERVNCDLELTKNEVSILIETLKEDKKTSEESLKALQVEVNEQQIKMVQMERWALEQVENVSEQLTSKLADFEQATKERIAQYTDDINRLNAAKTELENKLEAKNTDYEILFTDHEILKTTLEISGKESDSLKKHYEEQRIELDNVLIKLNDVNTEKKELLEKLAEVTKDLLETSAELNLYIDAAAHMAVENEDLKDEIDDLEAEVESQEDALVEAKLEILSAKETYDTKLKTLLEEKDAEIEKAERKKDEYKAQLNETTNELTILLTELEKERKLVATTDANNKSELLAVKQSVEDALQLNKELKERLDEVSKEADLERKRAENVIQELEKEKAQLLAESDANKQWHVKWEQLLSEKEKLNVELTGAIERKDYYKDHCKRLEEMYTAATKDEENAVKDFYKINEMLKEKEDEIAMLQKKISDLNSLIEPFREQLEQFEIERNLMENDREVLRRQHLEQAAKLGHQNQKQKIQHVVKLKSDLLGLRTENERLQVEVKTKNKIIEKLREQVGEHPKRLFIGGKRPTSTPFKGKENDSPVGIKHEAMSPSSPLRNRNQ